MIVYHGSNVVVDNPRIIIPNRYLDFGAGFYTTTNKTQAVSFADKVTNRRKAGTSCVSVYELNEAELRSLQILSFDAADESWLDFVYSNRAGTALDNQFDLIIGPVANDDVYRTFVLYTSGIITKEQTLDALRIKKLYNQYVFATNRALSCLRFVNAFFK